MMKYDHPAQLLYAAYRPPIDDAWRQPLPDGARCAMTGHIITTGVAKMAILAEETSQPHEIFKVRSEYVSPEVAALFKDSRLYGNLLAIDGGAGYFPVVSRSSADPARQRPCWHDLVEGLYRGWTTVAIFTDNTKRRLWPFAPLGVVGDHWDVYVHLSTPPISQIVTLNYGRLRECLSLCYDIYAAGFSKEAIRHSLFRHDYIKSGISLEELWRYERLCDPWRGTPEFLVTLFILQKPEATS